MRLLATADWQAGVQTVSLEDQEVVWHRIVDLALERQVDLLLHGGDLVEGPVFTMEQLAAVRRVFKRLTDAGIPIMLLTGNSRHDLAVRPVHALDLFRDYGIHVSDRPEVVHVAGIDVATLPWVHPGRLIARTNGSVDHDRINEVVASMLVQIAAELREQTNSYAPRLLVAHWSISGAALPSGISVDEMREPVLPWAELDALGYDAIIAGHIHAPQRLDNPGLDRTLGFYCGSPQPLNHGERGEHGCWIVTLGEAGEAGSIPFKPDGPPGRDMPPTSGPPVSPSATFVPLPSRQFVTIDYDPDEPLPPLDGAIVRVRARLTREQTQELDQAALRQHLLEAGAHSVRLDIDIEREQRRRAEISEQVSPADAMLLYCEASGIQDPLRSELRTLIKAWSEE